MKPIRKRLTYANVMSSIAVFMVLGGAAVAASQLPKNSVGTKQLKKNAVKTAKIGPGAVKTGKLAKEAVKAGKLANGAVLTDKLGDAAVTSGKLANDSVLTDKLANDAVTTGKIANDAVTTGKIANDAVTTGKIANDAVTGEQVKESSLGQVPSAANANALGGIAASGYAQRMFARVSYTAENGSLIAASPGISVTTEGGLGFPRLVFPRSMTNCAIVGSANSGAGTQIFRRSTGAGAVVQFALKDDAGAAVRSDFEVIAVC